MSPTLLLAYHAAKVHIPTMRYLMLTFLVTTLLCGCQTPNRTAYRTLGTIATLVDASTGAYYTWRDAGHYNAELDAKIKAGFLHYQEAMKVAQKAQVSFKNGLVGEGAWEASLNAVSASASELVGLIRGFLPKEKLPQ